MYVDDLTAETTQEVSELEDIILTLHDAEGTLDDMQSLCKALNTLEKICIDYNAETQGCVELYSIGELLASAGCDLDPADLPSWCDTNLIPEQECWSATKGGRYLLYPAQKCEMSSDPSRNLSNGFVGWTVYDHCEGQIYALVGTAGYSPELSWLEGTRGTAWFVCIEEDGDLVATSLPVDWNPVLHGWEIQ